MLTSIAAVLAIAASVSQVAASPASQNARGGHHAARGHHLARAYANDGHLLEDYDTYKTRYNALGCSKQHSTTFFDQCCHPMMKTEKLSDRPAQCTPSAAAASSAAAAPSSAAANPDAAEEYGNESTSSSAAPTSSKAKAAAYKPSSSAAAYTPPATTSYTPAPTPTPSPAYTPNTGGEVISGGIATYFLQNGVAGACGTVHDDSFPLVAVDYRRYGDMSQASPLCGKKVLITNTKNGKQVTATVADVCPTCNDKNCLDLSKGAFLAIATEDDGIAPISYTYI